VFLKDHKILRNAILRLGNVVNVYKPIINLCWCSKLKHSEAIVFLKYHRVLRNDTSWSENVINFNTKLL